MHEARRQPQGQPGAAPTLKRLKRGRTCRGTIRRLAADDNTCSSPDYANNDPDIGKHVEFVPAKLLAERGAKYAFKAWFVTAYGGESRLRHGERNLVSWRPGSDCSAHLRAAASSAATITTAAAARSRRSCCANARPKCGATARMHRRGAGAPHRAARLGRAEITAAADAGAWSAAVGEALWSNRAIKLRLRRVDPDSSRRALRRRDAFVAQGEHDGLTQALNRHHPSRFRAAASARCEAE